MITIFLGIFYAQTSPTIARETLAKSAFVIDQTTGTILISKNALTPLPPASMSKLMTLYMTFEAIKDGRLRLDERLRVSEYAMSLKGSTMFLDTTDRVVVEDLLRGIIVLSGNDACVVIAEALSPDGTEAGFARLMTQRARQLGMEQATFVNSSGWPHPDHRMSMRDLAIIADRLIIDFPEFYSMFSEQEFIFDNRVPANSRNRNSLLGLGIGVDGLKTGYTKEAGYGIVASAEHSDRRIIVVISGLESTKERTSEAEAIINWAFRQFKKVNLAKAGTNIVSANVQMGTQAKLDLIVKTDIDVLIPVHGEGQITAEAIYQGPVLAPILEGQEIGELLILTDELQETRVPLFASQAIAKGGFFSQLISASKFLQKQISVRF
ncbi:MAG: D-alanyl-D-alanine carboxypeptidase [Aestuariivita sp.]|nr:D-alanyl-D-alanine carboxypeptidase [Aestuariivita sp.]